MSLRSVLRLVQVARPAPNDDCIGVALFGVSGSNMTFVAECNDDLNIARFTEFTDFDKFQIESDFGPGLRSKRFEIGDPIPIPYWIDGELRFVMGNTQTSSVRYENVSEGVMASVVGLLKDARSGQLRRQSQEWRNDHLRAGNPDIFQRSPRDTRHWVARFAVVAGELDWQAKDDTRMRMELRQIASLWLERHLANTSYERLAIFLGIGRPHMFGARRRADIMQAYLQHIIARARFKDVEKHVMDRELRAMFPKGLTARKLGSWSDIQYPAGANVSLSDSFMEYVRSATQIDEWTTIERLAFLLFANQDMPFELLVDIRNYVMHTSLNINSFRIERERYEIPHRKDEGRNIGHFGRLPSEYFPNMDGIKAILGILDGKQRLVALNHDSPEDILEFEKGFFRIIQSIAHHKN